MNAAHVRHLARVEVRRAMSLLGRLYLAGAGGLALFFALGQGTDENILVVIMGVTLGAASVTPFAVMRDKLDKTLEFLLSLPVGVADLVMARFMTAALGLLPGALATGVTFSLVSAPPEFGPLATVAPLQFTLAAWCLTAAAASEVTGLIGWSVAAMVVFVGFIMLRILGVLDREGAEAALQWFLEQPFAGAIVAGAVGAIAIIIAFAAFAFTHRGFTRYEPRPERPL